MLQVFHHTNFRVMWEVKYVLMAVSGVSMLIAIGAMTILGFNYGIDFAGGTSVQLKFREAPSVGELRSVLEGAQLGDVSIQTIGKPEDHEVLIRVERHERKGSSDSTTEGGDISSRILEALHGKAGTPSGGIDLNTIAERALRDWLAAGLSDSGAGDPAGDVAAKAATIAAAIIQERDLHGGLITSFDQLGGIAGVPPEALDLLRSGASLGGFALRGIEFVGPTAGRELMSKTRAAIFLAVIGILVYVWVRFHKIAWGVTAIISLVHDITLSAGAMALTGREVSLPVVAALLTILGYSINDTIVVFDRIRENLRLYREHEFEEVVNASLNQTFGRTVLTSFTAFLAVTALFMYGGDKLNPLAFCLMVGVIVGSYSTISIAAPLLVIAHRYMGAKYVKA